jgi:hypothetical protein
MRFSFLLPIIFIQSALLADLKAQEKAAAKPEAKTAAAAPANKFAAVSHKILDYLENYNKVIATVKDLPTAKLAKPKIDALTKQMEAATKEAAALGPVPPEVEKEFAMDTKNLERAGRINQEMSVGGRKIIMDKAVFAELQASLAQFQRAMRAPSK